MKKYTIYFSIKCSIPTSIMQEPVPSFRNVRFGRPGSLGQWTNANEISLRARNYIPFTITCQDFFGPWQVDSLLYFHYWIVHIAMKYLNKKNSSLTKIGKIARKKNKRLVLNKKKSSTGIRSKHLLCDNQIFSPVPPGLRLLMCNRTSRETRI